MGNCVDREPPDASGGHQAQAQADDWSSWISCGDDDHVPDAKAADKWESIVQSDPRASPPTPVVLAKPHGLAAPPRSCFEDAMWRPLRQHFLSAGYRHGAELEDAESAGYTVEHLGDKCCVYRHGVSGKAVWTEAIDVTPPGDEQIEVLFCYVTEPVLATLAEKVVLTPDLWTVLLDSCGVSAESIFATKREPAQISRVRTPLVGRGPQHLDGACEAFQAERDVCVAILAPESYVVAPRNDGQAVGQQTLDIWVLRPPDLGKALSNSAENLESRWRRVVQYRAERFGSEHFSSHTAAVRLAAVLEARGKLEEAELTRCTSAAAKTSRRVPPIKAFRVGVDGVRAIALDIENGKDPGLQLTDQAAHMAARGRLDEAEKLHRRALREREVALGPSHPRTLESTKKLAQVLRLRENAEDIESISLPSPSSSTSSTLTPRTVPDLYGLSLHAPMQLQVGAETNLAESKYRRELCANMHQVAGVMMAKGRFTEAERLYRRALDGRSRDLGPDHPDTRASVRALAQCLELLRRRTEAAPLWKHLGTLPPPATAGMDNADDTPFFSRRARPQHALVDPFADVGR